MTTLDICASVYSFCEYRGLPVLVTDHIARYLAWRDLFKINTLSQTLNEQTIPIIYKDIVLDFREEHSRRRAPLLLRTLLTNPTATSSVRSLSLLGDPLYRWRKNTVIYARGESVEGPLRGRPPPETLLDLRTFTPFELELYQKASSPQMMTRSPNWTITLSKLCLDIISLFDDGLEDLNISSDYFRYHDFRKDLMGMFNAGGFRNLKSSSLCTELLHGKYININAARDWDDTLLTPFMAPSIDSITAVLILNPKAVSHVRASSVTRLCLHHCQVQDSDLDGLLLLPQGYAFSNTTPSWTFIGASHIGADLE